jgi:hypothetical protein
VLGSPASLIGSELSHSAPTLRFAPSRCPKLSRARALQAKETVNTRLCMHKLLWPRTPMADGELQGHPLASIPGLLGRGEAAFQPTAWKRNSAKFTVASAADYSLASAERRGAWPQLVARRGDLAPCVTPLCSKRLRLATLQLPEKSLRYKSGAKPASRKVGGWYLAKDAPRRLVQAEGILCFAEGLSSIIGQLC